LIIGRFVDLQLLDLSDNAFGGPMTEDWMRRALESNPKLRICVNRTIMVTSTDKRWNGWTERLDKHLCARIIVDPVNIFTFLSKNRTKPWQSEQ
jgi:hypothetical protein